MSDIPAYMGTLQEAQEKLRAAYVDCVPYWAPLMATIKEHKRRDRLRREAERRLLDAARMVGWHLEKRGRP